MKEHLYRNPNLVVRLSKEIEEATGSPEYGVFATDKIKKGEIVSANKEKELLFLENRVLTNRLKKDNFLVFFLINLCSKIIINLLSQIKKDLVDFIGLKS